MKKLILLLTVMTVLFAQMPTSEYLYLDIHSNLTGKLPNGNPAYLESKNIPYSYAFQYNYFDQRGDYRRPFDPEAKHYNDIEVSAYREMDNGLLFAGRFAYRYEQRKNKLWLHNAETNINVPFYFADSTIGGFDLNGIDWNIIFSYPLSKVTRIAVDIFYNVDEQFKTVFPKPNVKRNDFHIRPAVTFSGGKTSAGLMVSYFKFRENIQTKKYSLEQGRSPIFMRIRGLDRSLLTYAETSEERLQTITGYSFSGNIDLGDRLLAEMNHENASAGIVDGGSYPVDQGNWDMNRWYYRIDLRSMATRYMDINIFFKQHWDKARGYHPDLNALIYQYGYRNFRGGVNVPYSSLAGETWTSTIAYGFEDIHREDNLLGLAHYIPWTTFKVGIDYQLIRKGIEYSFDLNYNNIKIGETLEYNDMADWYYDTITVNEIAYYATDREEIEGGLKIAFPFRGRRAAISGTYKEVRPINNDTRFHETNVSVELQF